MRSLLTAAKHGGSENDAPPHQSEVFAHSLVLNTSGRVITGWKVGHSQGQGHGFIQTEKHFTLTSTVSSRTVSDPYFVGEGYQTRS